MTNQLAFLARRDYFYLDAFWCVNLVMYTAVSRKVVLQKGKSLRDNVESYYGYYDGFYACLSEPEGASAWKN